MNKKPEKQIDPIPKGYHNVTPWIMSRNSDQLIKFIEAAFNGKEMGRVHNKDGSIGHAEIRVGDSVIMMFDKQPAWPDLPALIRLYVDDADVTCRQALEAGAKSVTEVTHLAFGDKVARVRDPLGNVWWIQTHIEDVDFGEMQKRLSNASFREAMEYLQSSFPEELSRSKQY